MKKHLILASIIALLASTSLVSAQRGPEGTQNAPSTSPSSPSAPAEKMAPQGSKAGASEPAAKGSDTKMGGSPNEPRNAQGSPNSSGSRTNDDKAAQGSQGTSSPRAQSQGQSPSQAQAPSNATDRNATSGSQSNVNVNLSSDQRTRIRETVVKETNAPRIDRSQVNFNLTVGTVVPRTVRVATLPAAVVQIHPAWRGYSYILVGDEIVILEPGSLRIVAIIPA